MKNLLATFIALIFSFSIQAQDPPPVSIEPAQILKELPTAAETFNIHEPARIGRQWLKLLDQHKFAESWEKASVLVKKNIKKEDFVKQAQRSRLPLGSLIDRKLMLIEPSHKLPNAPKGEYLLMTFESKFNNTESPIKELVMLQRDPDKVWRVAGYYIK